MHSLGARLAVVAAGVLAAFFGLAGLALDRAHRASLEQAVRERLEVQVRLLLGAAEVDAAGTLAMPEAFTESRYDSPASGLTAAVDGPEGATLWRSGSSAGHTVAYPAAGDPGVFAHASLAGRHAVSYPVIWELDDGTERRLVFQVAESARSSGEQVAAFRRSLWSWLAGVGLALVVAQSLVLRWGLAPVRRAAHEIAAIERGERERLGGEYPRELRALTENVNALLASSATRLGRYRNALDDLAHSLKTPLAVLRGESAASDDPTVGEQVDRMDQAIAFHVQRAAMAGRAGLGAGVDPVPVVERLAAALDKVHAGRAVAFELEAEPGALFHGDGADLTELLGNLLDNAYKWSDGRVRVTLRRADDQGAARLAIEVEDDGPGIPEPVRARVLERGYRADELVPGQGIGLAVAREMVEDAYAGTLALDGGELGGARVRVVV